MATKKAARGGMKASPSREYYESLGFLKVTVRLPADAVKQLDEIAKQHVRENPRPNDTGRAAALVHAINLAHREYLKKK